MERPVGEAVDERDVEALVVEERAELVEAVAVEQLARVARRQPQAEAERRAGESRAFSAGA